MRGPDRFSFDATVVAGSDQLIERLCVRAGLVPSNNWTTDEFFRLWSAADEEFADAAIGLDFGVQGVKQGYSVATIVALHAPDFRGALATLSRYKRLTCPEAIDVEIIGDEAIVRYRWLQANGAVPRLLADTTLASLHQMARQGSGERVAPLRLELARKQVDQKLFSSHFGCPIVFGVAYDAMVFPVAALDIPFIPSNAGAFGFAVDGVERSLVDKAGRSDIIGELRLAIARQLSEGRILSIAAIAGRLGLGSRTLQRRLGEHATSFQHQLAQVRRIIAGRLLTNTDLDPIAIAILLGFAEPNSFMRAFRGWERTTPLRWRNRASHNHTHV
jgi:AraC-like DNA-binding protein